MKRLGSLIEVASLAQTANDFGTAVVEFLDQFNIEGNPAMLSDEPPLLRTQLGDNGPADAYLAAVALHLSRVIGEIPPAWIVRSERYLHQPWFASPGASLRATLLLESPTAFRDRNLFVSANAFDRA